MAIFMQVENYVKDDQLILSNEEECKHLHYVLRDFASLLQIIGRLSHLFIGKNFANYLTKFFVNTLKNEQKFRQIDRASTGSSTTPRLILFAHFFYNRRSFP